MKYVNDLKHCGCKKQEPCDCEKHEYVCGISEMPKRHYHHEERPCPDRIKGFNFCKKRTEIRCFKQCQPISQPCDGLPYTYFVNNVTFGFTGLVVVRNTDNACENCVMDVRVFDRTTGAAGASYTVPIGASLPIFVDCLQSLTVTCTPPTGTTGGTCNGEIIFDLEYCATLPC